MELKEKTIGDYVAENFRTAAIFKKYGIDFCCRGGRTIEATCEVKKLDPAPIYEDLANVQKGLAPKEDFNSWDLPTLTEYIKEIYHDYIQEKSIYLLQFLDKLCRVHGDRNPELFKINELFTLSSQNLIVHLRDKEEKLFPFIIENKGLTDDAQSLISKYQKVYQTEIERFREIAEVSSDYTPPEGACTTYRVAFQMLEEFDESLQLYIHLENNILFPKFLNRFSTTQYILYSNTK